MILNIGYMMTNFILILLVKKGEQEDYEA